MYLFSYADARDDARRSEDLCRLQVNRLAAAIDEAYRAGRAFRDSSGDFARENMTPAYAQLMDSRGVWSERADVFRTLGDGGFRGCRVRTLSVWFMGAAVMQMFAFHPLYLQLSPKSTKTSFHFAIAYTIDGLAMKHRGLLPAMHTPLSLLLHSYSVDLHKAGAFCCYPLHGMAAILRRQGLSSIEFTRDGASHHPPVVPANASRCWPSNSLPGAPLTVVPVDERFRGLWKLSGRLWTHARAATSAPPSSVLERKKNNRSSSGRRRTATAVQQTQLIVGQVTGTRPVRSVACILFVRSFSTLTLCFERGATAGGGKAAPFPLHQRVRRLCSLPWIEARSTLLCVHVRCTSHT